MRTLDYYASELRGHTIVGDFGRCYGDPRIEDTAHDPQRSGDSGLLKERNNLAVAGLLART